MVFEGNVNYFAVFGAAFVSFIIGWLWYGPLFGKVWMKEMKISQKDMELAAKKNKMMNLMVVNFVGTLIMVYVLSNFMLEMTNNYSDVFMLAFWIWLGFFAATTLLGDVLWEGRSWKLYTINAAYWLVNLVVAGLVLFAFR